MIIKNELRIGNYVRPSLTSNDFTAIEQLRGRKALTDYSYNTIHYQDLRPIKLTEEILPVLGFTKDISNRYFGETVELFFIDINTHFDNELALFINLANPIIIKKITSVHQLQNIWRDLTDIELKIKLL